MTFSGDRSTILPGMVSVIVPVFNRPDMLLASVASVISQTYRPIEVIVVDDGSTDGTPQVAMELASRYPGIVQVLRQENSGPGVARNAGLRRASGEFVQYLDSDDLLEPRKFEWQVAALREHPQAGVAYGLTKRVNLVTGESRDWARTGGDIAAIFPDFLSKRGWDTNSPLWRRETCSAIGPWSELRCMEDWEHDLRAGLLGFLPVRVAAHVATVRDHDGRRASGMTDGFTPDIMRDFFRAHRSIWKRMRSAGRTDRSYLDEFSRKLFWIARMCGERGLVDEADEALAMAREMRRPHAASAGMIAFHILVRVVGWQRAVAIGERVRTLLKRAPADVRA